MKKRRLLLLVLLLLTDIFQSTFAQEKGPSSPASQLKEAWTALQIKPNDPMIQERYLSSFPHDYKAFLELFDLDRELYVEGHEYIDILPTLARSHESEVGKLLVKLAAGAHYDADAPSYLQHATAIFGSQHTQVFAKLLGALQPEKQSLPIAFLADVENPDDYVEYQSIIDHLKALGIKRLANRFEIAKRNRSQGKDKLRP